jgi:hypothetical protein
VHFFLIGLLFADFFIFDLLNLSRRSALIAHALMQKLNKKKCSGSRGYKERGKVPRPNIFLLRNTFFGY